MRLKKEDAGSQGTKARRFQVICRVFLLACCFLPLCLPAQAAQRKTQATVYQCVMDPDVKASKPGMCPRCGMALRKVTADPAGEARNKSDEADRISQIPDTMVYDQNGKKLRFYSDLVKGKTVAINFIFTTCTTICPPLTATFRRVQQELGERVGRDVNMISISVDPTTDVPERLKAFSTKFNAGPGWTFVTGDKQEINLLLKALGANVGDKNDHSPMMLVGNDSTAYWTRTYGLASVSALVKVITDAAGKTNAEVNADVPLPGASRGAAAVQKRVAVEETTKAPAQPVTEVKKTRTPAESAAAYFPNTVMLTQDNKPVRFFDDLLKGKTVIINFMFTTCTGICPPMTANLAKVQDYLGERVGRDVNMISISVDPTVDTPEALRKYADSFKAKTGWYFLTGKKEDVDLVLRKVGGFVKEKDDHSTLLMIGNIETGEWVKAFAMAKPAEIADQVIKIVESKP
ncbi:MAG: SCO family protein [Blastocatellia bacterium]